MEVDRHVDGYNEADTRAKLIDPRLHAAGWAEESIAREYSFTKGQVYLVGDRVKRKQPLKADYLLRYRDALPISTRSAGGTGAGVQGRTMMRWRHVWRRRWAVSFNPRHLCQAIAMKLRAPRGKLAVAALCICILVLWFVLARSEAGWPGALGFGDHEWPTFWATFWAGAFPTIVTGAIVAVAAGVFLSNRDRRLHEQALRQRYREEIVVFQQGMSRIVAVPDLVLPVQHLPDTVPSTAAAARQMIVQQPIGEWRKYVSDYEPLFKQIIGFSVACDDFEQLAAAFDNEVGCAIRELSRDMRDQNKNGKAFANSVDEIRDDSIFLFDECRFKTYVVGQLLEIDEESINFRLDTSDYERTAYAVLWERVRRFDVMPIGIDSYRSGLNRVWEAMYALRTALATQGH